jgi:hypothetical protein
MKPGNPNWELLKKLPNSRVDPVDSRFYLDRLALMADEQ